MSTQQCPFCHNAVDSDSTPTRHTLYQYNCDTCGQFFIEQRDLATEGARLSDADRSTASALLRERSLKQLPAPVIVLGKGNMENARKNEATLPGPIIHANDLLLNWPATVSQRIARAFCNLCRCCMKKHGPGSLIELTSDAAFYFAGRLREASFYISAMKDYGWIRDDGKAVIITAKGWAEYEKLTQTESSRYNPVFVAMWFGGDCPQNQNRMTTFFKDTIRPDCKKLGWLADRVDSQEHNDSIIDRIIAMIRIAPFVIADLSDENRGVYYEAGYARGRGIEVIYLVKEGTRVHFDVSGVNHLRWTSPEELAQKLENRILGTMGRGPHSFS